MWKELDLKNSQSWLARIFSPNIFLERTNLRKNFQFVYLFRFTFYELCPPNKILTIFFGNLKDIMLTDVFRNFNHTRD